MKKLLCALTAALLLAGCFALAEGEPEVIEIPQVEVVQLDEGDVSTRSVDDDAEADESDSEASARPKSSAAPEDAPETGGMRVGFEDGFALRLPEGWLFHPTTEEMAERGVTYCLSDADGAGWLYVQSWETDCADTNELKALIDRTASIQTSGVYAFNGTDFVVYDLTEGDVSCCAALLDDRVINLVFTPQSDAAFMAVAAQILNTFELL